MCACSRNNSCITYTTFLSPFSCVFVMRSTVCLCKPPQTCCLVVHSVTCACFNLRSFPGKSFCLCAQTTAGLLPTLSVACACFDLRSFPKTLASLPVCVRARACHVHKILVTSHTILCHIISLAFCHAIHGNQQSKMYLQTTADTLLYSCDQAIKTNIMNNPLRRIFGASATHFFENLGSIERHHIRVVTTCNFTKRGIKITITYHLCRLPKQFSLPTRL